MPNPFTYYKSPTTTKEAQESINYYWFEGMLSNDEIEDLGHVPAQYRTFIKSMTQEFQRIKRNLTNKES